MAEVKFAEGAAPSTPAADTVTLYAKADGLLYSKDDAGTETLVSGTTGTVTGPGSSTDNAIVRFDGTGGTTLQDSGIVIDDTDNVTGITTVTIPNTGLHLLDTDASHDVVIKPGSNVTADRTLTLTTGDADRTLTISGDATISQDYSSTGNPQFATIELGAASDTTLARSGAGDITVEGNTIYRAGGTDVPVADGGTGRSSHTAYAVICGGTTSTAAQQSIAGVGTSGQVLTSNGAGALPTFQAASTSVKPFMVFNATANQPPASAYATPDTRNAHPVLDFDGATDEEAIFGGVLSPDYADGGLTCELYVAFTSATSGTVRFQAAVERIDASSLDIDSDSFAAFQSAGGSAPGTSGQVIKITVTFTDGAQMDSLAAGEAFRLKIRRDADGTSGTDDITTDAELLRVVLRET